MKTLKIFTLILAAITLLGAAEALAASTTQPLTINATVSSTAKLELSSGSISFSDADPDSVPSISSSPATVTVTAKAKTSSGSTVALTVAAGGDLTSPPSDTIDITNVTWTATGSGFDGSGTMNTISQPVASWTNSGNRSGDLTFKLANSWLYKVGSYSATATFTLNSP